MKLSRCLVALILVLCVSTTVAEEVSLAGFARDPRVKRWIWFQVLGPRNSPFRIVYLSTQHFKTTFDESLIVLPSARYDVIASYTQARIAAVDCPGKAPVGDVWYTVAIAEHAKGGTRQCVLPQRLACEYLSGAVKLSDMRWTEQELRPISDFMAQVRCGAHGADGNP